MSQRPLCLSQSLNHVSRAQTQLLHWRTRRQDAHHAKGIGSQKEILCKSNKHQIISILDSNQFHFRKKIVSINLDVFSPGAAANSIFANFSAKKLPTAFFFELQIAQRIASRRSSPHPKSFILIEIIEKLFRRVPSRFDAQTILNGNIACQNFTLFEK